MFNMSGIVPTVSWKCDPASLFVDHHRSKSIRNTIGRAETAYRIISGAPVQRLVSSLR